MFAFELTHLFFRTRATRLPAIESKSELKDWIIEARRLHAEHHTDILINERYMWTLRNHDYSSVDCIKPAKKIQFLTTLNFIVFFFFSITDHYKHF